MIKARVSACFFGAETEASASLPIAATKLAAYAAHRIKLRGGVLADECRKQRHDLAA